MYTRVANRARLVRRQEQLRQAVPRERSVDDPYSVPAARAAVTDDDRRFQDQQHARP